MLRALCLCIAALLARAPACGADAAPPLAAKRPHVVASPHGDRIDEYHWLRDDDAKAKRPEVMAHLKAENAHTEAVLARIAPLRRKLLAELRQRVRADDSTVPVYGQGWWHWQQFEPGNEHPLFMRRRGTPERMDPLARPEVLLDVPRIAIGFEYFSIGSVAVSPAGRYLAWTEDITGRRIHTLRIQDLRSRRVLAEPIDGVLEDMVWAADSRTLLYIRQDPVTLQTGAVYRHRVGTPAKADALVYDEADKTLFTGVRASASRRFALIEISGYDASETRVLPLDKPEQEPQLLLARRPGVREQADHLDGRWVVRTNDGAPDFRLAEAVDPARRETWRDLLGAQAGRAVERFELFEQGIAVEERVEGRKRLRVLRAQGEPLVLAGGDAGTIALGEKLDASAAHVQVVRQSLVQPAMTLDLHLARGQEIVRRREQVTGFDAAAYRTQRLWAPARDGQRIPVTLAWRQGKAGPQARAPTLIEGYGAYGDAYEPEFAARRLSLLDRGFVVAIAHVRGGSELGQAWYEAGRLEHKHNSFDDFVAVTDHLVQERWADPARLFAEGGSAGGLLMGVVANRAGHKYRGMALDVPFVDAVTTLLDASIPLTAQEWRQWGDPREASAYQRLLSYSPYDNIGLQDYPAMLVTTALWDAQVQYFEPAKYVARLRASKTDRNPLLLHVELNAGHGGAAGRYERLQHWARQYAFFIDLADTAP